MAVFQGTVLHHPLPFYQMSTGNYNKRPMMKRRRFIDHTSFSDDNDDGDYAVRTSKRFASEEIMSSNMRNLCLTTPPHYTEYQIDESDWSDEPCDTSWSNHNVQDSVLEDIAHPIITPVTTPSNHDDLTPPTSIQRDNTVILEETNSDSSDDDNSVHVWIAPEMKTLMTSSIKPMNQSSLLLPDTIVEEISKPCQALVPISDIHSIWNCHGSHDGNNDTNTSTTDKDCIESVMPPSPSPVPLSNATLNVDELLPDYSEDEEDDYIMEL